MNCKQQFSWSDECEPHKLRTKKILSQHPEIRELIGRNPYTFLIILLCVALQSTIAYFLRDSYWWLVFVLAYFVGAFADHTLFVCIHESSHNLIFKKRGLNTVAGFIANLPLIFASYSSFKKYHLKHHAFQGIEALDADMPSYWEAKLVGNSTIKKALWLLFYPIAQASRLTRMNKEVKLFDKEMLLNWLLQIIYVGAVYYFCGWKGIVFQLGSFFFSVGLHPLGARWVQEHFLTDGEQETKSYYGPLNVVNLNVGFHNEHHDFPSVPWHNLPKIKKIANEHYDCLASHTSYTKLLFKFLFCRELSVFSRMARSNKGKSVTKVAAAIEVSA
ncbi:fatty acid desaturase [Arachidicoccus ginsenosidimutans]|uniref:fatty acid desaturase n=1 Tax=Arachidicoccus sp. BS20 TaxID=1850526 RepID=UPI0007F0AE41|nr:fatty acid desaturase [Arachidicoccus sp. BS20]ANI89349.1 fatty acid desaturase [Arachidicoccus sp. BS20]